MEDAAVQRLRLTQRPNTCTIVRMRMLVDANCFLAVVLDEPERAQIIEVTRGQALAAPEVLPYEIGNALSAMVKRGNVQEDEVPPVWERVQQIPVELRAVDIRKALHIATAYGIYAYDAYYLLGALELRLPLLTLDKGLARVARNLDIAIVEFHQ